ncbi:MAG: hypothetical protein PVF46_04155, partial [Lysobacterales bacterium]
MIVTKKSQVTESMSPGNFATIFTLRRSEHFFIDFALIALSTRKNPGREPRVAKQERLSEQ